MFKAIRSIASATFVSRILGLIRDQVSLLFLGSGAWHDAWLVAFRIPNFMRALFVEGAFSQAFIPILVHTEEAKQAGVVARVSGTLSLLVLLFCLPFYMAGAQCVLFFVPGYADDPEQLTKVVQMLHWTMPYLWFITMTGLLTAWLNGRKYFKWAARLPLLLNVCLILGCLAMGYLQWDPVVIAKSVFVAGLLQCLAAWSLVVRYLGVYLVPMLDWQDGTQRRIFTAMSVAAMGSSLVQISNLLDTLMGSFLPSGSMTLLYIAQRLAYLPVGVFAVALTSVALPQLSKRFDANKPQRYAVLVHQMVYWMLVIGLPAGLGLLLWRKMIIMTIFGHGLSAEDIEVASFCLGILATGLPAFIGIKILSSACFAARQLKWPMYGVATGIAAYCVVVILGFYLHLPSILYVALGGVISAYINVGLLWYLLIRQYQVSYHYQRSLVQPVLMGLLAIVASYALFHMTGLPDHGWLQWFYLVLGVNVSVLVYLSILYWSNVWHHIKQELAEY